MNSLKRKQLGFTPIEFMIALTLGGLLTIGMFQVLISTKQVYRMQDNLARVQENGRFALNFIANDIRQAGSRACFYEMPDTSSFTVVNGFDNALSANIFVASPGVNQTLSNLNQYTDVLELGNTTVTAANPLCDQTTIPDPLPVAISNHRVAYSIQINSGQNPALYRSEGTLPGTKTNQEIVENVENMQVLYGPDTNGDMTADYYAPAGTPGLDMAKVVSIRVSLMVRSSDNNLISWQSSGLPPPIFYNGSNTTIWDSNRKLRRVFSSTIAVRNRLL